MQNPKISVIIPVYNVAPYLPECLDSVLGQTFQDIEVLCVNDGSTDNSLEVLQDYKKKDFRVRVFSQKNSGAGPAQNHGLREMRGDWFVIMGPDDFYANENVLQKLYDAVTKNNVLIAGGTLRKFFNGNLAKPTVKSSFTKNEIIDYKDYQFNLYYTRYIYSAKLQRDNNIFFPSYRRYQDPPFFMRIMIAAKKFYAMTDDVYVYRIIPKIHNFSVVQITDVLRGQRDCILLARRNGFNKTINEIGLDFGGNLKERINELIDSPSVKSVLYDIVTATGDNAIFRRIVGKQPLTITKYELFGFIPFLKITRLIGYKSLKLFYVIPLVRITNSAKRQIVYLLHFIPLLMIRYNPLKCKVFYRMFGIIQFWSAKEKCE